MTTEARPRDDVPPSIPAVCLECLSIAPVRYLGGNTNQHWLVETSGSQLVLRSYARDQIESVAYELEMLRRLHQLGWPVPELVDQPVQELGRLWCLFTLLPGASLPHAGPEKQPEDRRARGRLLAELHDSTASLADMGQRRGWRKADEVVRDPALIEAIRKYEAIRPDIGHVLRWHLDKTLEMFEGIVLDGMETIVLHGDFAPWNLLFEHGQLSGILDFELTHLNYRVADFALSWRGYQQEVIDGYQEVRKLTDRDWQLLVPVFWSWIFSIKEDIDAIISGNTPAHGFEWSLKQLLKRSPLHHVEPYPGLTGHP